MPSDNQIPQTFPEDTNIPPIPSGMAQDTSFPNPIQTITDAPPPEVNTPKRKFGGRKMVATILGILLLVGAVGAGVVLIGQKQLFQQKASTCIADGQCKPTNWDCCNQVIADSSCTGGLYDGTRCAAGSSCIADGQCKPTNWDCCNQVIADSSCTGGLYDGTRCAAGSSTPTPTPSGGGGGTCSLTGSRICVGNDVTGPCYQGGQGGQYACYKLTGDYGKVISNCANEDSTCSCTCPSPYTWKAHENGAWWCFDTAAGQCDGQYPYAERCSLQPQQCSGATPTPTSSPPGPGPRCLSVKAYDTSWNPLTGAQLSALVAGDIVRFTISGTPAAKIDKAKFKINTVEKPAVTQKKPGTEEFYDEYTIPAGVTSFTVNAKLHHVKKGWF